jgi:serine/threonine protein phosphatase PrpC
MEEPATEEPAVHQPTPEETEAVELPANGAGPLAGAEPAATADTVCPTCGEARTSLQARFCEACGTALTASATRSSAARPSSPTVLRCEDCNGDIGRDGYCTTCGMAGIEPVTVDDRDEMAAATHRGRRRPHNQDAAALAITREGWPVLIVADGVSRSPNPDVAAQNAAAAAAEHLAGLPFTGADDLIGAVAAAHAAASATPIQDPTWTDDGTYPACTLVIVVAGPDAVHAANVGDTRAYLLEQGGDQAWTATLLTTDHSVGHALTSWLGADGSAEADIALREASPGDVVLACSDGLWNYAPESPAFGRLVGEVLVDDYPDGALRAAPVCERLVTWALTQGGTDNISVALAAVGAGTSSSESSREDDQ